MDGYIPKSMEAQERFLWWDFDQTILLLLVMGMRQCWLGWYLGVAAELT